MIRFLYWLVLITLTILGIFLGLTEPFSLLNALVGNVILIAAFLQLFGLIGAKIANSNADIHNFKALGAVVVALWASLSVLGSNLASTPMRLFVLSIVALIVSAGFPLLALSIAPILRLQLRLVQKLFRRN